MNQRASHILLMTLPPNVPVLSTRSPQQWKKPFTFCFSRAQVTLNSRLFLLCQGEDKDSVQVRREEMFFEANSNQGGINLIQRCAGNEIKNKEKRMQSLPPSI